MPLPQIVPVIMCGGAGTRLWPVSRESMPKQFVPLVGPTSTFQQVLARISDPELFARPIVITNTDFRFVVAEQLRERGIEADIVLEPVRRDSGPAVAVAAVLAAGRDPDAIVLVLAADHVVRKPEEFRAACRQAAAAAAAGRSSPSASRPRIRRRITATSAPARRSTAAPCSRSRRSSRSPTPRPRRATWPSTISGTAAISCSAPTSCSARSSASSPRWRRPRRRRSPASTRDLDFLRLAAEPFARAPKKSIDYAVMERTKLAAVVPADIGWSDVGSWGAVWDVLDRDDEGNAVEGPAVLLDSRNSLVRSDESVLTTVVGLDNVVVVATADAVLVAARDKAEDVKALVEQLKAQNRREAVEHRRIYRPWGYYQGIDLAERYQVKRIVVKPGSKLSLQKHFHRAEHWVVVKGTAEVTIGEDVRTVHENESVYIPIGSVHRLANPGRIPLELIEVQVGSYLGEDDIVRLDDVYGRGLAAQPAPDADVLKPLRRHVGRPVDVAQIDDDGVRQRRLDAIEIERAELIPFGQDHHRVGIRRCRHRDRARSSSPAMSLRASVHAGRIIGAHVRALRHERRHDHEARRLAHVVGVRLEGEPEHRDRLSPHRAAAGGHDLVRPSPPCARC